MRQHFSQYPLPQGALPLWLTAHRLPFTSFLNVLKLGPIPPLSHGWSSPSFTLLSPAPTLPPAVPSSIGSSAWDLNHISEEKLYQVVSVDKIQQHLLGWRKPSPPEAVLRAPGRRSWEHAAALIGSLYPKPNLTAHKGANKPSKKSSQILAEKSRPSWRFFQGLTTQLCNYKSDMLRQRSVPFPSSCFHGDS